MNKVYVISTIALIFSLLALMFYLQPTTISWLDGWGYRTKLTINSNLIDEELINFTILVFLNISRINYAHINDYLFDIRFTDLNNNLLYFEVEFDWITNNSTWFWVQLPFISNITNTSFYCYYGNPDVNEFPLNFDTLTWNKNYVMVNHMVDGSQTIIYDSTINNNDCTKKAINEPIETDGKISKAQSFDGINDYIEALHSVSLSIPYNFTVSMQIKYITKTGGAFIAKRGGISDTVNYAISPTGASGFFRFEILDGTNNPSATADDKDYADGAFHHVVCTRNVIDDNLKIYVDGVLKKTGTDTTVLPITNTANLDIGKVFSYYTNSILDEIRIYNQTQPEAWIKADYYSQIDNLLIYGSEEFYG